VVANEVIDEMKRKKECIIVKVEFDKAYDMVSWEYLIYMIERLVFVGSGSTRLRGVLNRFRFQF